MSKVYICTECQGYGEQTGGCVLTITDDALWKPRNCVFGVNGGFERQGASWMLLANTKHDSEEDE